MISKLNPVLIGGFDVIFIGKKGFSSLARARKVLLRPKGAGKKEPWLEIDLRKYRTKAAKNKVITKTLQKLTRSKDVEAEKALKEEKIKEAKKVESKLIKFTLRDTTSKLVRTKQGELIDTKKFFFRTKKSYEFVEARELDIVTVNSYIQAVKREFLQKVYPKYGKASYLIRFYHEYKGIKSTPDSDPENKGFGGMSINRQVMDKSDVNEQFMILTETYLDAFTKYLQFGRSDTYFRFTGFTVEVVVGTPEGKALPKFAIKKRPKKKRSKRITKAKREKIKGR